MTSLRFLRRYLRRYLRDTGGATALEYALLAALVAGVIIAAVGATGRSVAGLYADTSAAFEAEVAKSSP